MFDDFTNAQYNTIVNRHISYTVVGSVTLAKRVTLAKQIINLE